jgi:hypothetical protein
VELYQLTFYSTYYIFQWYPCGSFKGDQQSKGLCENYSAGGFFAGMAKKQLDSGIAGTLYRDMDRMKRTIIRVSLEEQDWNSDIRWLSGACRKMRKSRTNRRT